MRNALRDLPAWGISLIVNLMILFALSFIVQSVDSYARKLAIETEMEERIVEEEYIFSETTTQDNVGNMGETDSFTATASVAQNFGKVNDVPIERKVEQMLIPSEIKQFQMPQLEQLQSQVVDQVEIKGQAAEHVQGGVDGVMDRITLELRRSTEERQTLAVWLFDASGSLAERREAMAGRFDNVYKQLAKLKSTDGIHTVVASYGKSAQLITPQPVPGDNVKELVEAVKQIKEDKSGVENVFSALRLCVERFKTFSPGSSRMNRLVFIVTDERGDDFQQLEEVINLCKQFHFRVFCIGNGSVFGQEKGYVRWKYEDGFEEDIPVDQGPETAFAQVLQLPFIGSPDDWRTRKRMSAGFGPYTLTRLCSETGGLYLLTEESRGDRFDPAQMRTYAPDYRPVRVIDAEIRKNPAMAALVQAAAYTYEGGGIPAPETVFRGYNDNILREDLAEAQKPVAETNYKLQRLHQILEAGEKARSSISDPRWRASFDLAMGRILAMRVRLEGYQRMLAAMSQSPQSFENPKNNEWILTPAQEIETGPQLRKAGEQAREYLKRVIDEHPGTPWALMAERELSQDLGWSWKESERKLPGMQGENLTREEQVRLLLAEEEKEEEERRMQQEKPRERPKL